jgi:hypothetical protein
LGRMVRSIFSSGKSVGFVQLEQVVQRGLVLSRRRW